MQPLLQMIVGVLEDKNPTTFFNDEFRSPVYVQVLLVHPARYMTSATINTC